MYVTMRLWKHLSVNRNLPGNICLVNKNYSKTTTYIFDNLRKDKNSKIFLRFWKVIYFPSPTLIVHNPFLYLIYLQFCCHNLISNLQIFGLLAINIYWKINTING